MENRGGESFFGSCFFMGCIHLCERDLTSSAHPRIHCNPSNSNYKLKL